ncbi:hypothetical protein C8R44DRAFT_868184 [Mycena epipterygia]|nr:hypothetical protein C8R44DRAFT_868184 [Mycena epipterygia]
MSYSSTHPLSVQSDRRPSQELSTFSTMFQQWDIASSEGSSGSRRGSQQFDSDGSSGPPTPVGGVPPSIDFDNALGAPPARQRTGTACDKCRDRKTKCSGDHPVCKRCTARGLICHYSGRERIRGPAKARLRNAMSSSSLDLRFAAGQDQIKQESFDQSFVYPLDYSTPPQPQYHHVDVPTLNRFPYHQHGAHADPLSRTSLPQVTDPHQFHPFPVPPHLQDHYVRRVQSYSALGASDAYRPTQGIQSISSRPISSPAVQDGLSRMRPPLILEYDLRMPNGTHAFDYNDDGSGSEPPPSATESVFSNVSHSSGSSESTVPEPLSRSASELDLRMLNQLPQYRHSGPPMLKINVDEGKARYPRGGPRFGFYSPAASISSLADTSSPRHDVAVPQINGEFGNPWAEERVTVREVELMYPSPVTPITLGNDAIDMMARGGFHDYLADQGAPGAVLEIKEEQLECGSAFELLNTPLTEGTPS